MELLKRLHGEAVKILVGSGSSEAQSRRDDADTDRRLQIGYETCEKVLAELDPRESRKSGRVVRRNRSTCPHETP
jgi:hypothetical protein